MTLANHHFAMGLSPRGRGNLSPRELFRIEGRSIPAWAGEPEVAAADTPIPAVYPRVGGGTRPRG